ncbi:unnamed protein product [Linum tenue]|uniref:Anthranilate phosphoribosyltransferase n=1 Tax=Linum tenue TaxID=586396 RepID=A0AAV0QPL6_9ROSI|nr:unnamed protein product [Linum tenue]
MATLAPAAATTTSSSLLHHAHHSGIRLQCLTARLPVTPFRLERTSFSRAKYSNRTNPPLATTSFNEVIESLINGVDLSESEAEESLNFLLGDASEALISAFLVLMRAKGETFEEIVGFARAMLSHALKVEGLDDAVDIVGTGGDGANTVNISTGASILAAACGAKVAKQGNRSSSSACGSADVLEALGVAIDLDPEGVSRCVKEAGIGFMMAPRYHPAMKVVSPVRKKLKVKTIFNILGPMLNPARVPYAVVGVFREELVNLVLIHLRYSLVIPTDKYNFFLEKHCTFVVVGSENGRSSATVWNEESISSPFRRPRRNKPPR